MEVVLQPGDRCKPCIQGKIQSESMKKESVISVEELSLLPLGHISALLRGVHKLTLLLWVLPPILIQYNSFKEGRGCKEDINCKFFTSRDVWQ